MKEVDIKRAKQISRILKGKNPPPRRESLAEKRKTVLIDMTLNDLKESLLELKEYIKIKYL